MSNGRVTTGEVYRAVQALEGRIAGLDERTQAHGEHLAATQATLKALDAKVDGLCRRDRRTIAAGGFAGSFAAALVSGLAWLIGGRQ